MRLSHRLAVSALSLVSAASLVACGGASDSTSSSAPTSEARDASTASGGTAVTGEITVFAAASLKGAYQDIAEAFEQANPDASVSFDFQGSQDLVSNLSEGSAADVLATADTQTMDDAAGQNLVGEQREFATNVLSILVPAGNPGGITGFDESLNAEGVDLAVCNSQAPCGHATEEMERATGVTLDPDSEESKVSDVRGKVESGQAEAGIVYTTDAVASTGSAGTEEITIPDLGIINHDPIAMTAAAANSEGAQAFIDFVLSDQGQEILRGYGFGAPAGSASETPADAESAEPAASETPADAESAESAESETPADAESTEPTESAQAESGTESG